MSSAVLPTWQLAGHVVPSFEKFLASFLCLKAVTQHNFLEFFGKFAEELHEIIERNLRALRAKLFCPRQAASMKTYKHKNRPEARTDAHGMSPISNCEFPFTLAAMRPRVRIPRFVRNRAWLRRPSRRASHRAPCTCALCDGHRGSGNLGILSAGVCLPPDSRGGVRRYD
jgi:hypothetical protein